MGPSPRGSSTTTTRARRGCNRLTTFQGRRKSSTIRNRRCGRGRIGACRRRRTISWEFHNYNAGASGLQSPYHIPGKKEKFLYSESPLRQGSYRGLAATANHFVRESYMDELAESVKLDPLAFRLKN